MPFCPECGAEFVEGVSTCSDCGVTLVTSPPPSPQKTEETKPELVEVYRARDEVQAQLIRGLLESSGIDCTLKGESVRLTFSIAVDGLAEVRILVRPENAQKARDIIASAELGPHSPPQSE